MWNTNVAHLKQARTTEVGTNSDSNLRPTDLKLDSIQKESTGLLSEEYLRLRFRGIIFFRGI